MKHTIQSLISCIFLLITPCICSVQRKAVVAVPVADLVGQPLRTLQSTAKTTAHAYHALPLCGGKKQPFLSCPRMHQALLHEVVIIQEQCGQEVKITVPNVFFITKAHTKPHATYWTLKKNIIPYDELNKGDLQKIPAPISYAHNNVQAHNRTIATLIAPFYDPVSKQHLSAGTRFVIASNNQNIKHHSAYVFDKKTKRFTLTSIPKTRCLRSENTSNLQRIQQFVRLLKQWVRPAQGFIPYVWGGCSVDALCTNNTFDTHTMTLHNNKTGSFFARNDIKSQPLTGLDCAGLIVRAAQICGIPFFYKNTTTIAQYLPTLKKHESVQAGDIIWIPWHVMIVSDIENNALIEARGYSHGFGKVHEIALNKVFKGINTYKDLLQAYRTNKPLQRIDKSGKVRETLREFKLLTLVQS